MANYERKAGRDAREEKNNRLTNGLRSDKIKRF
jgi:hypothetical protein